MAQIDVSELLCDPDFVDKLILVQRRSTVNEMGENIITNQNFDTIGSVQPASGKTISRLPDEFRVANVSSFWIKGTITTDANGRYSDIIIFKCQRYTIQTVQDWSNYGQGYCEGTCVREVAAA